MGNSDSKSKETSLNVDYLKDHVWNTERLTSDLIVGEDCTTLVTKPLCCEWNCGITKNPLLENYLYGFTYTDMKELEGKATTIFGVCDRNTKLDSKSQYGTDKLRYGFFVSGATVK